RPADMAALRLYCYRVAGVVGLMMAHVMGISDERALKNACDLGIAMQLTNIARDVMADFEMGRCYLPADLLQKHGLNFDTYHLPEKRMTLAAAVRELLAEADEHYKSGELGTLYLSPQSALVILIARFTYARIGRKVIKAGAQAWDRRQYTSKFEKLICFTKAAFCWLGQMARRRSWSPAPIRQVWRLQ
ncbi:MAG: squalene/phytoene synthase family protein, partial [Bdellovibrionaceae bacterium]|nr:squalene/phytoene synthase family protein [Pseudobdellovibrionaceae bacterium]